MKRIAVLLCALAISILVLAGPAQAHPEFDGTIDRFELRAGVYGTNIRFSCQEEEDSTVEQTFVNNVRLEPWVFGRGWVGPEYQVDIHIYHNEVQSEDGRKVEWTELSRHDAIEMRRGERELAQVRQALNKPGYWEMYATLYQFGSTQEFIVDRWECALWKPYPAQFAQ